MTMTQEDLLKRQEEIQEMQQTMFAEMKKMTVGFQELTAAEQENIEANREERAEAKRDRSKEEYNFVLRMFASSALPAQIKIGKGACDAAEDAMVAAKRLAKLYEQERR